MHQNNSKSSAASSVFQPKLQKNFKQNEETLTMLESAPSVIDSACRKREQQLSELLEPGYVL